MKNEALFQRIKKLVATERRISLKILECLREIERRKAYADLRYDGLYTYCVKELGFTESQAYQRIQAMRAVSEIPELRPMIESGSLSVSAVSKVQTHFRQERRKGVSHARAEKLGLFQAMENRTSREVDAKISEAKGEEPKTKLVLEMDPELVAFWKRVKDLAAHRSGGDEAEVLKLLTKDWLMRNDPAEREDRPKKTGREKTREEEKKEAPEETEEAELRRTEPMSTWVKPVPVRVVSRFISASLRRKIWRRDEGKCTRCSSRHALELDHVLPFALGGETTEENLRLLCRSCNQAAATKTFGFHGGARASALPA